VHADDAVTKPQVCEIPNQTLVDIPVPAAGERVLVDAHPGEALRLACEFKDVKAAEVGHDLELTFPSGGVAVIENFDEWVLAKGATVTDCKCGAMNLADFVVALGLNPEDVVPAANEMPDYYQGKSIQITERAPLWAGAMESEGYGLYSYLLFGTNSDRNRSKRLAAIHRELFSNPTDPGLANFSLSERNIFYLPLAPKGSPLVTDVEQANDSWFLCHYDYTTAQYLLRRIGKEGDGIYLASNISPLMNREQPANNRILVSDLSWISDDLIEQAVREYRRQVMRERYWDQATLRSMAFKLRAALTPIAKSIELMTAAIAGEESEDLEATIEPAAEAVHVGSWKIRFGRDFSPEIPPTEEHKVGESSDYARKHHARYVEVIGQSTVRGLAQEEITTVVKALNDSGVSNDIISPLDMSEVSSDAIGSDIQSTPPSFTIEIRVTPGAGGC
ncbi:MAG TPA: hypothetical protein VMQ73_18105, partial [Methylomirabilota bacterium]|nr:hypothetical protein [Methylomirabilota bacterium]